MGLLAEEREEMICQWKDCFGPKAEGSSKFCESHEEQAAPIVPSMQA